MMTSVCLCAYNILERWKVCEENGKCYVRKLKIEFESMCAKTKAIAKKNKYEKNQNQNLSPVMYWSLSTSKLSSGLGKNHCLSMLGIST